jgi:Ca2+-transporting ATPase
MENKRFYSYSVRKIEEVFATSARSGLSKTEAEKRLSLYGKNVLTVQKGESAFLIFLNQLKNPLVILLILASTLSFVVGERIESFMIILIVLINSAVGFVQEYKAQKTIKELQKLVVSKTRVIRDANLYEIDSQEIVPGDLIELEDGQKVPADARIIEANDFSVNQATLTGESLQVVKTADELLQEDLEIVDQTNMVFSGTIVASGKARAIVVATGMSTQIGRIASLLQEAKPKPTPMQQKLERLTSFLAKGALVVAFFVAIEEYIAGQGVISSLISAVALAVAAVPEGLPAIITITLALATRRLLAKQALVRHLFAAETLGSTEVVCVDKTGTLTTGEMFVQKIFLDSAIHSVDSPKDKERIKKILKIAFLASSARKTDDHIIGEATEASIVKAAFSFGIEQADLLEENLKVFEIPFSSERKMMSVVWRENGQGSFLVASKGALETILAKCLFIEKHGKAEPFDNNEKEEVVKKAEELAEKGFRIIAVAYKTVQRQIGERKAERDLVFLGFLGISDPPRKEAKEAIALAKKAGIRVVMITGDHLLTAKAIAKELGITGDSITGKELSALSSEQFLEIVQKIGVYARVNPEHKLRIVRAWQKLGYQVAMTGDGVNDAPSLKEANLGVAMGKTGTDVAREAADIVLLDDNFTTIISAIYEGRIVYDNIRKFTAFLLSSNAAEVCIIFFGVLLGMPIALLPIHLLWINLITDGLPALALGIDKPRKNIMSMPPQEFRENILNKHLLRLILTTSTVFTIAVLFLFSFYTRDILYAQSIAFTSLVFFEIVAVFAIRERYGLSPFSNKLLSVSLFSAVLLQVLILYLPLRINGITLAELFRVKPLVLTDLFLVTAATGISLFLVLFFTKISLRRLYSR